MSDKAARTYTPATARRLHALSGNQCAEPNCTNKLVGKDDKSNIGKISHIEAASENGPRYNPDMTDDERRHYDNLIVLCDEHHCIIDNKENEKEYPVALLKEWKRNHENKSLVDKYKKIPSLLLIAVNAIADIDFENYEERKTSVRPFNIDVKISYNSIKRNKSLIEYYKVFHSKLNNLYYELENQGSFKKEKLLDNINIIYQKTRGKYVGNSENAMEIIQENADNIFDDIENELLEDVENKLLKDIDSESTLYDEDISFGITIVMIDAFMRCRILENPNE